MGLSSSIKENNNVDVKYIENSETNPKQNHSTAIENTSSSFYNTSREIRKNETQLKDNPLQLTDNFINIVSRSICKLVIRKGLKTLNGTGFLIKLKFNNDKNYKYFLMSNEHVIKRKFIQDENIQIEVDYDSGFKKFTINLDKYERIIRTYEEIIDLSLIEIVKEDNVNEDYYLIPNYEYKGDIKDRIYIPGYPVVSKGNLSYSNGSILEKDKYDKYEISYDVSTDGGSSGSPIFLENSMGVVGIHKAGGKIKNYGDLIYPILNILQNKNENIYYKSGNYYNGEWKNGLKHGKGTLYYNDSNILYKGDFIEDKFEVYGEYHYNKSEHYVNQFKSGIMEEKGKLYDGDFIYHESKGNQLNIYKYGNYYLGEWKNGKKHGRGKIYSENNKVLFDGYFIDDKYFGNKIFTYQKGEFYIGGWKNKKRDKGILYYENGNIKYEGDFVDDLFDGNGKYYYPSGYILYEGKYKMGKKMGKAKLYYENGNIEYDGDFSDDKFHGNGKLYYENGEIEYEGGFQNGEKHGKGILYYANGRTKYEGGFQNGKKHGKGTLYYPNGKIEYEGAFKNDIKLYTKI